MVSCVNFWPQKSTELFVQQINCHVFNNTLDDVLSCNRFILLGLISTLYLSVCLPNVSIGQRRQTVGTKAQYEFRSSYEFPAAAFL
jgi:hypothetical protein